MRKDIKFFAAGCELDGWLYTPDFGTAPHPTIVMSHGFGAIKEMALDKFADVFCAAGFACLVYDHRNTGKSAGEPRGELDPAQQISDMRDAITYAIMQPEIDADRIGLWGTS